MVEGFSCAGAGIVVPLSSWICQVFRRFCILFEEAFGSHQTFWAHKLYIEIAPL